MAIEFSCPHCSTASSVEDKFAGMTGPCRECGQTITIPGVAVGANPYAAGAAGPGAGMAPPPAKSSFPWIPVLAGCGVMLLLIVGVLVALLLPAVSAARQAARRVQCANNLRQITLGMLNYESAMRTFPPVYSVDAEGKPMHSWRVHILPYIGEVPLYEQFRLDEPWDSPHNLSVAQQMPEIYRCPTSADTTSTNTQYMVVSDPSSAFPAPSADRPRGAKMREIRDGTSKTVAVVEVANSGVHWTEPVDLTVDELHRVSSDHDFPMISFLDGHTEPAVNGVTPSMVIKDDGP